MSIKMFMNQALLIFSLPILTFVAASTAEASVVDFCVADPSLPNGPAGFACKDPAQVVAKDFFFRLAAKGNTSNVFRISVTPAFAPAFAGINGLGVSVARVDLDTGGVVPLHTHRVTEIILVTQGTLRAGFISSDANQVYIKTLGKGDLMVFPQGLLHFQYNVGKTSAVFFASFSSDNPGLQIVDWALFQNNLPTKIVAKATLIATPEVQRLKTLFGGTN